MKVSAAPHASGAAAPGATGYAGTTPRSPSPTSGDATPWRPRTIPAQALLVRRWALQLLGTTTGPSAALRAAAFRCDPAAWDLFLRIERCAIALQRRLEAGDGWGELPGAVQSLIRSYAGDELMRALSAKAQLRQLSRIAAREGWMVLVLKGGAAVATGEFIHLGDLDILVEDERIGEVEAALAGLGYVAQGDATSYHLAPQVQANAIEIEVHRALPDGSGLADFRAAARPIEGEPGLWRQGGADHIRLLLRHATGSHPERAGRLRELLLLGHALRTATPDEIAEVEAGLAAEPRGETMRAIIGLARALNDRSYAADPFEPLALRVYILFYRFLRLGDGRFGLQLLVRAAQLLANGFGAWRAVYAKIASSPMRTVSRHTVLDWLDRRARPLAALGRRLLASLSFGAVLACAVVVDATARLTAPRRTP